jgi:hypothetical protein
VESGQLCLTRILVHGNGRNVYTPASRRLSASDVHSEIYVSHKPVVESDTSYSWSTNIFGTKVWYLFPPSVSHHLRRFPSRTSSEIVYDVRDVDLGVFKEFDMARREMRVVEQPPGSTIFV